MNIRDTARRGRDAVLHRLAEVGAFAVGVVALLGFAALAVVLLALVVLGFTFSCIREEVGYLLGRLRRADE